MTFISMMWWAMPIFIALVYLAVGFGVSKVLIKNGTIETVFDYWYYFILWLPLAVAGVLWTVAVKLIKIPKAIAEGQINKN